MISTPEAVSILEWKAEQIDKLLEGVTEGEWKDDGEYMPRVKKGDGRHDYFDSYADARFIAASRTLVPQMREMIRGALAEFQKDSPEAWDRQGIAMLLAVAQPFEAEWRKSTKGRDKC